MRQAVALFIEATGKQAIENVEQADVATFVGVMRKLPKTYRKSPKDRDLPLSVFIERGRTLPADQVGLAGATLNRNLATLGFLDYVRAIRRRGEKHLFPDLAPNKQAKGATFGGQIDYPIRQAVTQQLGEGRFKNGKAKTIHSFRHYVIGFLNTHKDIRDKVAIDIVGHEGEGEGKKRYGDDAELALKLAAISLLPSVIDIRGR